MKRVAIAIAALLGMPSLAAAHTVLPSAIEIAIAPGTLDATLHLPVEQLALAWHGPIDGTRLRAYVADHLNVTDERGAPYEADVGTPRWTTENDQPFIVIDVAFRAVDGHVASALRVHDTVIAEEVVSHRTLVTVTRDFERAAFTGGSEVLAMPRFGVRAITIDRRGASPLRGVLAMAELGARHIAEGLDHLLFLFVLLLPAALRPNGERWARPRSMRETLRMLLAIVTAFTIGHSTTLALAVLGVVRVPPAPVEMLVAASIGIGAVHAMRPLFAGREPLVAGLFGLVHGLAFASTLDGFGLHGTTLALALGAFDVGIESVQLLVVIAVAPLLVLAAREAHFDRLRIACAASALLASIVWLFDVEPLAQALGWLAARPMTTGAVLWLALAARLAVAKTTAFVRRRAQARRTALAPEHPAARALPA